MAEHGAARPALAAWPGFMPDLVLADLRLPVLDGLDVLQQGRQTDVSIPVVVMTAHGDVETAARAIGMPQWRTLGGRLPVRAAALGLRMLDWRTPLVASVEPKPGGGHPLSVWRYHP